MTLRLPVGFRFSPSDDDLISHYLTNFITGQENRLGSASLSHIIKVQDVYATEPWNLLQNNASFPYLKKNEMYFFASRKQISKNVNGKRPKRTVLKVSADKDDQDNLSGGFWRSSITKKPICDRKIGVVVGYMNNLCFYRYVAKKRVRKEAVEKTDWLMDEYETAGGPAFKEWVLCRIKFNGKPNCDVSYGNYSTTPLPTFNQDLVSTQNIDALNGNYNSTPAQEYLQTSWIESTDKSMSNDNSIDQRVENMFDDLKDDLIESRNQSTCNYNTVEEVENETEDLGCELNDLTVQPTVNDNAVERFRAELGDFEGEWTAALMESADRPYLENGNAAEYREEQYFALEDLTGGEIKQMPLNNNNYGEEQHSIGSKDLLDSEIQPTVMNNNMESEIQQTLGNDDDDFANELNQMIPELESEEEQMKNDDDDDDFANELNQLIPELESEEEQTKNDNSTDDDYGEEEYDEE